MALLEGVEAECGGGLVRRELRPHVPRGEDVIRREIRYPRREALVEPEVGPPLHGDQVAKPLVRELVGHGHTHVLFVSGRGVGIVHQQRGGPVRHEPVILHGPRREVGHCHHVDLGERVWRLEVLGEEWQRFDGNIQGEASLLRLSHLRVHAHLDPLGGEVLDEIELPDNYRYEVRGHHRSGLEGDSLVGSVNHLMFDGHVPERDAVRGHDHGDVEGCLECGLVPAREATPGVCRLELSDRHRTLLPAHLVDAAVEAFHLVVELALEGHGEHSRALGEGRGKLQHRILVLVVHVHLGDNAIRPAPRGPEGGPRGDL
mmetsp:Transcript_16955/g.53839  ORF Transcript_16955/g.53839 Transcript_16955/m.53839 type:complete len:316 (+) Transcript_16955:2161-3108(+)